MALIPLLFTLVIIGVLLWIVNTYIPMAGSIKTIINIIVVLAVVFWLLKTFGLIPAGYFH